MVIVLAGFWLDLMFLAESLGGDIEAQNCTATELSA